MRKKLLIWAVASGITVVLLGLLMTRPDSVASLPIQRSVFLPGATTDGHYQIELDCESCHAESFSDIEGMQEACEGCHGAELELVDDSHPQAKFKDPRNADRVASLDARWCVTCHQEHRPEITSTMGLSLPGDYCYRCHEAVGEERPTHADLPFDSCANSGCHNFHDNRALYEDFLVEHRDEPKLRANARLPERELLAWALARGFGQETALGADVADAPQRHAEPSAIAEWAASNHAKAGVNCSDCHAPEGAAWVERPGLTACQTCHGPESDGFLAGRHGMRIAAELSPMTPGQARLPMRDEAHDTELGCHSCHGAHDYDTRHAAVEACVQCHADDHTLAYDASPHAELWRAEVDGSAPAGSGVSCATCHFPRVKSEPLPGRIRVAHNQNDTLRPNDKMIRSSCMSCHGLGFAIDALADAELVQRNFSGRPAREVASIHYAAELRWELEGRPPPWNEEKKETP